MERRECAAGEHGPAAFSHSSAEYALVDEIVEKQNVGRVPEQGGNGAVRLAGDDQFKDVGFRREFLHERVRRVERQGLDAREMLKNRENILVGRGDG